MTNDEAIAIIHNEYKCVDRDCDIERSCGKCDLMMPSKEPILEAYKLAIKALEQQPCDDAISRQAAIDAMYALCDTGGTLKENPWRDNPHIDAVTDVLNTLPPVTPQQKYGKCKDCKWWKDSDGKYRRGVKAESRCPINTVSVANGWGYCYMFKPQESEEV